MKDIRITLRGEDFAAVSQSMIKLGVAFQVEPVEIEEDAPAAMPAAPRVRPVKKKPARSKSSGGSSKAASPARSGGGEASGADRLRAMVERNRLVTSRPAEERDEAATEQEPARETE